MDFLPNLQPENIVTWVFLGLFIFLILATVVAGIIGLFKGLLKTTLKTILKFILVVIAVFTTPVIANALSTFKVIPAEDGSKINLQVFIADKISSSGLVSPTNGMTVYETAIAIANAVIAYAVFLILLILIAIFIGLLTTIIYHGIFRWFLPVETRKEHKAKKKEKAKADVTNGLVGENVDGIEVKPQRKLPLLPVPGMLLGAVQEFVFVLALLAPITSLTRIGTSHKESVHTAMIKAGTDESMISMVDKSLDNADNSIIMKLYGVSNYDTVLMDKAGTVTLNSTSISLTSLVNSLFDVATPLIANDAISYEQAAGQVTINYAKLLSVETVTYMLKSFAANKQVMALIPPLLDIGLNAAKNSPLDISLEDIDINHIDWGNELETLGDIYSQLYGGIIEPMISEDGKAFTPTDFKLSVSTMSDEDIQYYADAVSKVGNFQFIKKNMGVLLGRLGSYLENKGYHIFPTSSWAYENIDWTQELSLMISSFLKVLRIFGMDLDSKANFSTMPDKVQEVLADTNKRNELANILVGSTTSNGLLDSQIASTISLPDAFTSLINVIPAMKAYVNQVDFKTVFKDLTIADFKSEVNVIFEVAGDVYAPGSKINIPDPQQIDFSDSETVTKLADLIDKFQKSRLFTSLYPSILRSILFNANINYTETLYGLTPYAFNYNSKNFLENIKTMLKMVPSVKEMNDVLSDSTKNNAQKMEALNIDTIRDLLVLVTGSDFFNADLTNGVSSEAQKNLNLKTLLDHLLNKEPFSTIGFVSPSITDIESIEWGSGKDDNKEIDKICKLLDDVKLNSSFFATDSPSLANIEHPEAVSSMIKNGVSSKVFGPSILNVINKSMQQYLDQIGLPVDLNEMRNQAWIDDSDRMGDLITLLKGIDLDHLDIKTLDLDKLNAMLTLLKDSELVKTIKSNDPFGYFLSSLLKKQNLYATLNMPALPEHYFDSTYVESNVEPFTWIEETETLEIDGKDFLVTKKGTVYSLVTLMKNLRSMGFDKISSGDLPSGFVKTIEPELSDSFVRSFLSFNLSNMLTKVDIGADYKPFLASIDLTSLRSMNQATFTKEIQILEDFYRLSSIKDSSDTPVLQAMFADIFNLSSKTYPGVDTNDKFYGQTYEGILDTLLDEFSTSELLLTKKKDTDLAPLAILMKQVIASAGLIDKVTLATNQQNPTLIGILNSVSDWQNETSSLKTIINKLQGKDISALKISGSGALTYEEAKEIMASMNSSTIFHRVPISLIKQALEASNINNLLKDPETDTIRHPINYYVHLSYKSEDIAYWQNDIDHLLEMVFHSSIKSIFEGSGDMSSIQIDTLTDLYFLYDLGRMNLLEDSRSYLFLNLMNRYTTTDFKVPDIFQDSKKTIYLENKKAMRLEELFFKNPKLLGSDGRLDESKAHHDLDKLKLVLDFALIHGAEFANMNAEQFKSLTIDFAEINNYPYDFTRDSITNEVTMTYRSDFTAEMIAGVEHVLFTNPQLVTIFGNLSIDTYANEYALVNTIEGRAINGIIKFANLSGITQTKATLTPVFALFGKQNLTGLIYQDAYDYFSNLTDYQLTGNSILAKNVKTMGNETVLLVPVISTTMTPGTLSQFLASGEDSSNTSYALLLEHADIN